MSGPENGSDPAALLRGIIWCRQVDNEAESPRYTPIPDSFPGLNESLARMKLVGDLAINASDTTDYWDPDPAKRFSYYRNLFLFPTGGGRYLCLGRMYLSTEERPRLGIKTLVLDAQALFAGHNAAQTLWQWYRAMEGAPPGEPPHPGVPALSALLARSISYADNSPDQPPLLLLSDSWNGSVETVFGLLTRMPESLLALSGILVFPYFIPAAKVDVPQLTRAFPLTLAAFRISSRATIDQRKRWVDGWTKHHLSVTDLAEGPGKLPSSLPTSTKAWIDEESGEKWDAFRSLLDGKEVEQALTGPFPAEEGIYRRKELARLAEVLEESQSPSRKKGRATKKSAPAPVPIPDFAPVPVPPGAVSELPPWIDAARHLRVEKVGLAAPGLPRSVPAAPFGVGRETTPATAASSPGALPFPTSSRATPPEAHITPEDVQRIVAEKVAEELGRFFTGENAVFADRFSQVDHLRTELKDLDDRLKFFAEKTLPLIRKTWTKVGELKQAPRVTGHPLRAREVEEVKAELWQELHRMEDEFTARTTEILERMESTLQTQGRIWLTLVREVEKLSEERQGRPSSRKESRS